MPTRSSVLAWRIPRNGGPWWAAVYGIAQSQTRLKWLSRSSSTRSVPKSNNLLTVTELRSHEERPAWWINGYGSQPSRWPQVSHISWYFHHCVVLSQPITGLTCETKQIQNWRCVTSEKRLQVLNWTTHSGKRQQPPHEQPLGRGPQKEELRPHEYSQVRELRFNKPSLQRLQTR